MTLVNRRHNQAYFGVSEIEVDRSACNPQYTAERRPARTCT